MIQENILQKLVDAQVKSFQPDKEYVIDQWYDCNDSDIEGDCIRLKISDQDLAAMKLNISEVKKAVASSASINYVLEKYKKALIAGLASPIYEQIADCKDQAIDDAYCEKMRIKDEEIERERQSIRKAALRKIKNLNLTSKEKEVLGIYEK
jgi:hypothetical protein